MASSKQLNLFGKLAVQPRTVYRCPSNEYEKFVNAAVTLTPASVPLAEAKRRADAEWGKRRLDKPFIAERIRKAAAVLDRHPQQPVSSFVTVMHRSDAGSGGGSASGSTMPPTGTQPNSRDDARATGAWEKLKDILVSRSRSAANGQLVFDFLVSNVELPDSAKADLFSPDVCRNVIFTEALANAASCYDVCAMLLRDFKELTTGKRQWGSSKIGQLQKSCSQLLQDIREVLTEASGISLPVQAEGEAMPLSRSAILKKELLKDAVVKFALLEKISEDLSRRIRVRVSQLRGKYNPFPKTNSFRLLCMHSLDMDWESALGNIADADYDAFVGPLTSADLVQSARVLQALPGMSLPALLQALGKTEHSWGFHHACAMNLLEWFPVLVVMHSFSVVVINLHEAVLDEHLLDDLINIDEQDGTAAVGDEPDDTAAVRDDVALAPAPVEAAAQHRKPGPAKGHGGRTPIHIHYPNLVDTMATFIGLHGFAAQERRHTDTANTCGVSLQQIRSHLLGEFPALKISKASVHRLMVAPNKHRRAARLYKGLVNAKIPRKENTASATEHVDLHFTMAQVNYANELFELFPDECVRISVDDKNKINVGTLAVSRFFQINRFFPAKDQPNYPDHDFPYANSKIVPSGYLVMKTQGAGGITAQASRRRSRSATREVRPMEGCQPVRRSRSDSPVARRSLSSAAAAACPTDVLSSVQDRHGRQHVKFGRTGDLHVFNRATKYLKTSPMTHANDLHYLLSTAQVAGDKKAVLLVSDNGPDWNPKFPQTFLYLGRLWRDLQLDALVQTTYAAGHSRFNMIERAWAPLSWRLVGVTLPITLPGERTPPCLQTALTPAALRDKEHAMFDQAMQVLNSYWNGTTYDGHQVFANTIRCGDEPTPYSDEKDVENLLAAGVKEHETSQDLKRFRQEMEFLRRHSVVRCNAIEFYRCTSVTCSHCTTVLPKATKLLEALRRWDNRLPTPEPLVSLPGHYKSLLQVMGPLQPDAPLPIDHGLPSLERVDLCPRGCQVVLLSKASKKRHELLVHFAQRQSDLRKGKRRADSEGEPPKKIAAKTAWVCNFQGCTFSASTQWQLRKHKEAEQHKRKKT